MNILIISNLFPPDFNGGAEKVAMRSAEFLSKNNKVSVLTTGTKNGIERVSTKNYPIIKIQYQNIYNFGLETSNNLIKFLWHTVNKFGGIRYTVLFKIIKETKPNIIYLHNSMAFMPQLIEIARKLKIPICAHIHDYSYICVRNCMFNSGRICQTQCKKCKLFNPLSNVDKSPIVTSVYVSHALKMIYERNCVFTNKSVVMHNIEPSNGITNFNKKNLNFSRITFGFIGAILKEKGIEVLLESFTNKELENSELIIAGNGNCEYIKKLKEKYSNKNIRWLGQVQPNDFYKEIDILVVPSVWEEPQALVLIEAINRRIPIVSSNKGGSPEIIKKFSAGLIYDTDSKNALSDILKKINDQKINLLNITPKKLSLDEMEDSYFREVEGILIESSQT